MERDRAIVFKLKGQHLLLHDVTKSCSNSKNKDTGTRSLSPVVLHLTYPVVKCMCIYMGKLCFTMQVSFDGDRSAKPEGINRCKHVSIFSEAGFRTDFWTRPILLLFR
jgi:hypothetical protein